MYYAILIFLLLLFASKTLRLSLLRRRLEESNYELERDVDYLNKLVAGKNATEAYQISLIEELCAELEQAYANLEMVLSNNAPRGVFDELNVEVSRSGVQYVFKAAPFVAAMNAAGTPPET